MTRGLHVVRPAPAEWRTGSITTTGVTPSKGDKRLIPARNGRPAFMSETNSNDLKPFVRQVRELVGAKYPGLTRLEPIIPRGIPVALRIVFRMPLLKSNPPPETIDPRTGQYPLIWHAVAKDADKMVRAIGDALTEANVWADDGQCCYQHVVKIRHPKVGALIEWRSLG